ncbi:MAG: dihydroorotase family protein [Flavobacteriales bacterium]
MKHLVKNAKVVDTASPLNGQTTDILIESGIITKTGKNVKGSGDHKVWEEAGLHVSPGWFDPTVHFCDPGEEFKEDLFSGMRAAEAGGFTGVGLLPVTNPPLSGKGQIEYIINKCKGTNVEVIPYGSLSANLDHENLAEMQDMHQAGARAFTDYLQQIDAGLLLRAIQYTTDMNVPVFSFPTESSLTKGGLMHEGKINIQLGLKGIPAIAEEIAVARDLFLVRYNQARLHFLNVSTAGAVEMIRKARKDGQKITAQTTVNHLFFSDADLTGFDTNLKVTPPLRSKEHMEALIKGIADGTIDCITSDHFPQDIESKKVEFDQALDGIAALEAAFGAMNYVLHNKVKIEQLVTILSTNPRKILGLPVPVIKENEKANITLFNPDTEYTFTKGHIKSKGVNCPYIGKKLRGQVFGIIR